MAVSASDISLALVRQARAQDPSISAEVGTPERLLLDLFAQALADAQVDLTLVSGALDVTSKVGDDLDRFFALFGFARQQGTQATGFVTLSRSAPATVDLIIPTNSQFQADVTNTAPIFQTTVPVTMAAGLTSITVPIQCVQPGEVGNVDANTITQFVGKPVFGFSDVTNPLPTTGGSSIESDPEYQARFQNTVFRNLAGTQDQYMALSLAAIDNTKVNVIGSISRYKEYVQVPPVDDNTAYDIDGDGIPVPGNGLPGEYTTALSTIPYSKYTYSVPTPFVNNGDTGVATIFYRPTIDFIFNAPPANAGDSYRLAHPTSGPPLDTDPLSQDAATRPNVTFNNVVPTGSGLSGVIANQVVLLEHTYVSESSRNDPARNISNCVDVFVDGINEVQSSTIIPTMTTPITQPTFDGNSQGPYYVGNFQRRDEPGRPPIIGNTYYALFNQPTISSPDSITVTGLISDVSATNIYYKDIHYFDVEDISPLYGTVRARNGIEFNTGLSGQGADDPPEGPYTGNSLSQYANFTPMEVDNYSYNKNVLDLQASLEANKQVTTDVLVHKARPRYLKLDITVMYNSVAASAGVNTAIQTAVAAFFNGQYFGTTIQLSDLLNVIHNVNGVDNVRWSRDVDPTLTKVVQTDASGNPITNAFVDQMATSMYRLILGGQPTEGSFELIITQNNTSHTTPAINWNATLVDVNNAINAAGFGVIVSTIEGTGTPTDPFIIVFNALSGVFTMASTNVTLGGGPTGFNNDFFLLDSELPVLPTDPTGATIPGLTIRARSQNTWTRGG